MRAAAFILAAATLAVSVATAVLTRRSASHPSLAERIVDAFAPRAIDPHAQPCAVPEGADLGVLMRRGVNARMSALSFALHHDPRPREERLGTVGDQASDLIECLQRMRTIPPDLPLE